MRHLLKPSHKTVHWGSFDANLKSVLEVKSGDTIEIYTVGAEDEIIREFGNKIPKEFKDIFDKVEKGPGPHVLTGPIYVEGASPGDTLEVSLIEIEPWTDFGLNLLLPSCAVIKNDYSRTITNVPINKKKRLAVLSGLKMPIRPFFGVLGVAPPTGIISSITVGQHGGNLDNKELVASSKVYLPINVNGALFSIGDGHCCQGDGEVNGTGLEASLRGIIRLTVKKGLKIKWPMAETKESFILMAFAQDLDDALKMAVKNTIEFLVGKGFDKDEAYVFCSLGVDFRITQAVNNLKGVHAMLPKDILRDRVQSLF